MTGMSRRSLSNTQLVLISLLAATLLAEGGLRVVYGGKFGKRPGFFIGDEHLGWKPAAGLHHTFYGPDFTMDVATDENGYRLGSLGPVDFRKRLVVMVGDSYTFGWGVSTGETCASYLDERVAEASHGQARVVNLGVGGYGTLQSYERLERFFERYPDADIAAVVMFHAPNDPVDNVNSIGYYIGAWKVIDRQPKARSSIHLLNFADYVAATIKARWGRSKAGASEENGASPYLQDVAFAFDYQLPRSLPPTIQLNGHTVHLEGLSEADYSKPATTARGSMSPVQREVTVEAVRMINDAVAARGVPIVHGIVASAPDWFAGEMTEVLEAARDDAAGDVDLLGRFPDPNAFGQPYINQHFGKHYTPEFNEYWAGRLMLRIEL